MTNLWTTAKNLGVWLVLAGSIMFVVDIGVDDTIDITMGNTEPTDLKNETLATFDNNVGFVDRVSVTLITVGLISSLGLITISRSNPEAVNQFLRYAPLAGLAIGVTQFGTEVADMVQGEHDFDTQTEAYNSLMLVVTGWVIAGIAQLMRGRN